MKRRGIPLYCMGTDFKEIDDVEGESADGAGKKSGTDFDET